MLSKQIMYKQKHVRFYGHIGNLYVFFNSLYLFKAHFEKVLIIEINYRI